MIWNDKRLRWWAEHGGVTPYRPESINPASIDLCLGDTYRTPTEKGWSEEHRFIDELLLPPNSFVLMHSLETTIIPDDVVAFLYLKSSTGRKGLEHLHAGYGDPGFNGQWTFEVINHWPYFQTVRVGQPLFQLVLAQSEVCEKPYGQVGHYQNQTGATIPWEWKLRNIKE